MSGIREVRDGGVVLARHVPASIAWTPGLTFFSADDEFIQVGVWGYDSNKQLAAHIHKHVPRDVSFTQEVIYVRRGRIRAYVYGLDERLLAEIDVHEGDILALLRGGHGYDIIDDGTQVLEVKNGPYVGPDLDRRRL
jgi:hypothetical protein